MVTVEEGEGMWDREGNVVRRVVIYKGRRAILEESGLCSEEGHVFLEGFTFIWGLVFFGEHSI